MAAKVLKLSSISLLPSSDLLKFCIHVRYCSPTATIIYPRSLTRRNNKVTNCYPLLCHAPCTTFSSILFSPLHHSTPVINLLSLWRTHAKLETFLRKVYLFGPIFRSQLPSPTSHPPPSPYSPVHPHPPPRFVAASDPAACLRFASPPGPAALWFGRTGGGGNGESGAEPSEDG